MFGLTPNLAASQEKYPTASVVGIAHGHLKFEPWSICACVWDCDSETLRFFYMKNEDAGAVDSLKSSMAACDPSVAEAVRISMLMRNTFESASPRSPSTAAPASNIEIGFY